MNPVAPSNQSSFLSPVQKVTLLISAIVCVALIAIGAVFHQKIPGIALYATGASGACAIFLSVIILSCKTSSSRFASEDAAPGLPIDEGKPLSLPSSSSKTIEEILQEAFDYIDGISLPEEEVWSKEGLSYGKRTLKADFETISKEERPLNEKKNHLIKMKEALPFHLYQSYDSLSTFPKTGITNYGHTCFANVFLQAMAHTRVNDYLLLRPFTLPPPETQNFTGWKIVLSEWPDMQKLLYHLIENLRVGIPPALNEIQTLISTLAPSHSWGEGNDSQSLLIHLRKLGPNFQPYLLNCCPPDKEKTQKHKDYLSYSSTILLGSSNHAVIAIKLKKNKYQIIDDARVVQRTYSLQELEKIYKGWDFDCLINGVEKEKISIDAPSLSLSSL